MASPQNLIRRSKELRYSMAATSGNPATESDLERFELCRKTRISSRKLISLACQHIGNITNFSAEIGFAPHAVSEMDNGHWQFMCAWLRWWIPRYEKKLREEFKRMSELTIPDSTDIQKAVAEEFGIPYQALLLISQDPQGVDLFIESNRANIDRLAELKLMSLVASGDAPTIRWYLSRRKRGLYGDLAQDTDDKEITVTVVEE